jgi:hypothetical protein
MIGIVMYLKKGASVRTISPRVVVSGSQFLKRASSCDSNSLLTSIIVSTFEKMRFMSSGGRIGSGEVVALL